METTQDDSNAITCGEEILYHLLFTDSTQTQSTSSLLASGAFTSQLSLAQSSQDEVSRKNLDDSYAYLQEINSYHIDRLQIEPTILLDKKQQIQDEIKNLAFSNYKTFIRTAQCSKEIYGDFSVIESKLDGLISRLPEFGNVCDNFTKMIQILNTSRRSNNLTLQKHNQLLEILEISQLMDTCVRNEYYEEALDLANYVKRLDKKFSETIPLIKQIVNDVNQSLNLMLKQLLQQLKTNLQFNQCLKIIGIIRRLDVFTESELRVKFLQLRDTWFQSLLNNIPTTDPYHHITKTIEENRIHLFDIITQYRAIFSDDSDLVNDSINYKQKLESITNASSNEAKLFYCWLQQKIKNFLAVLKRDLNTGVGNRLDSVLSQSMYFGLAFSRVGLDFRVLMVPLFEEAILNQIKKHIHTANSKLEDSLNKLNWSELYIETSNSSNSNSNINSVSSKADLFSTNQASNAVINPPIELMEFQPLAVYLNCLLVGFNEFRLCAPLSLFAQVADLVRDSLRKVSSLLDTYYRKEKSTFDANESELFKSFVCQLAFKLVPFLEQCLLVLFPVVELQKVLSIAQNDLNKLKQCLHLDVNLLLVQLKELIPVPLVEEKQPSEQQLVVEEDSNLSEAPSKEITNEEESKNYVVENVLNEEASVNYELEEPKD